MDTQCVVQQSGYNFTEKIMTKKKQSYGHHAVKKKDTTNHHLWL